MVFTNGYSITMYQDGISRAELELTEGTWDRAGAFEETLRPLRNRTEEGKKKSFRLVDADRVREGLR